MEIGKKIRYIRNKKKITMKELAKSIGISEQGIGNYERGDRTPNIETLKKIAAALGINVDTLTCDESFGYEILNRAMQLALKNLFPDANGDAFMVLGLYSNYDELLSFYNHNTGFLSTKNIIGLLNFIFEKSKTEFNKIYSDLIETNIYDLDNEIENYCKELHQKHISSIVIGLGRQQGNKKDSCNKLYEVLKKYYSNNIHKAYSPKSGQLIELNINNAKISYSEKEFYMFFEHVCKSFATFKSTIEIIQNNIENN